MPRKRLDADARQWKRLATTIGEVILAMNALQGVCFFLYWKLLDPLRAKSGARFATGDQYLPIDQAMAVWNVISSDATQRDMMLAAAKGLWPATPKYPLLMKIKWLKSKADLLGAMRNDAARLSVVFESAHAG